MWEYIGAALDVVSSYQQSEAAREYGEDAAKATKEAAEANAKISRRDAEVARQTAEEIHKRNVYDMQQQMRKVSMIMASQRTGYAARGVVVSTGSPLDVQIESYRRGMKDLQMIEYNGLKAETQAKNLAQRYEMLAEAGLKEAAATAANIENAYNQKAQNIMYEGTARAMESTYEIGQHEGWWK